MLASVRTVGTLDSFTTSVDDALGSAGGFVSFVHPPVDFRRAHRFHAVVPPSIKNVEACRLVVEMEDDFRALLTDNPALLTGMLPQEAPRWQAVAYELGSDNYIG